MSHAKKNEVLQYVEESKGGLDGMILFPAHFDRRFFLTGLPTLFVDYVPTLQIGFKDAVALGRRYETKFVTATYGSIDVSKSVAEARMDDLVEKIELFNSIRKMKSTKIMDVQVRGFGSEPHEHWWRLNQEEYLQKLKESLGMTAVIVNYRDLFKEYLKAEEEKARKIAEKWMEEQSPTKAIRNRRNVGGVTKEEVTKAAKLYLAGDKMMKELGCNAITMDATTWAACESFAESIGEEYLVSGSLPLTREKAQYAVSNIRNQQESLEGVLFFGTPPDELISIGLPTVAVHPCWGQWEYPFNPFKGKKVLTSFLPVIPDRDETVFPSRLEDIAGKIGRIQAISKMKGLRVLVVTDRPVLGAFEPTSLQTGPNRKEYERVYLDNLRETFETEFLNISQEEMVERMKGIGEEAEKVAEKWIDEAEGIKGTNKDEIVKSAKLYLGVQRFS